VGNVRDALKDATNRPVEHDRDIDDNLDRESVPERK
jgi:hypothetical protein